MFRFYYKRLELQIKLQICPNYRNVERAESTSTGYTGSTASTYTVEQSAFVSKRYLRKVSNF